MHFQQDWTNQFAEQGYAVIRGLVDRSFCDTAMARAREMIDNHLPLNEWTSQNTPTWHRPFYEGATAPEPIFEQLFQQPRLRAAIESLYGGPGQWNEQRNYYLFIKAYDPAASAKLSRGHIDFPNQGVPPLYRGFTFQLLLADTEPFSGNLTVFPGTHKLVQKALIDNPQLQFEGGSFDGIPQPPPFEFVGKAGDVCFVHHLIFHAGNPSHSPNRLPRIALHAEAFRDEWLVQVDPDDRELSPWERSLAHNGAVRTTRDLEATNMRKRQDFLEGLKKKSPQEASDAYR